MNMAGLLAEFVAESSNAIQKSKLATPRTGTVRSRSFAARWKMHRQKEQPSAMAEIGPVMKKAAPTTITQSNAAQNSSWRLPTALIIVLELLPAGGLFEGVERDGGGAVPGEGGDALFGAGGHHVAEGFVGGELFERFG